MVGETVDEVELTGVADDEGVVTDVEGEVGSCCVASIEVRRQLETPPEDDGNGAEMDIGDGSGAGVELWAGGLIDDEVRRHLLCVKKVGTLNRVGIELGDIAAGREPIGEVIHVGTGGFIGAQA
ncbi:hypothetical protein U1Q18_031156 [Sarracenia purpurea var. burkii]